MSDVFQTVEKLLTAKTTDLMELAKIAGVPADVLYIRADLKGVDLRGQDISILLASDADLSGAMLDNKQLQKVRARRHQQGTPFTSDKNRKLIEAFLIGAHKRFKKFPTRNALLSHLQHWESRLRLTLDVGDNHPDGDLCFVMIRTLEEMWVPEYDGFEVDLFKLMGGLDTEYTERFAKALEGLFAGLSKNRVIHLVSLLRSDARIDALAVEDFWYNSLFQKEGSRPVSHSEFILQIMRRRMIHEVAIPKALPNIPNEAISEFLRYVRRDLSEKAIVEISTLLVRKSNDHNWISYLLASNAPNVVKDMIIELVFREGSPDRIMEAMKNFQKNSDQSGVGALSLENAFGFMKDFDAIYSVSRRLMPTMNNPQRQAIIRSLRQKAISINNRKLVNQLESKFI